MLNNTLWLNEQTSVIAVSVLTLSLNIMEKSGQVSHEKAGEGFFGWWSEDVIAQTKINTEKITTYYTKFVDSSDLFKKILAKEVKSVVLPDEII
jgi:hypothetical protein